MTFFDFFKNLFGWADKSTRKRRADDLSNSELGIRRVKRKRWEDDLSSSDQNIEKVKREQCSYDMGHRLVIPNVSQYSCDGDDDFQTISVSTLKTSLFKKLSNGINHNKTKSCYAKPAATMNTHAKSIKTQCARHNGSTMDSFAENSNQNIFTNSKDSTLSKTHRLREKTQYGEMLQNSCTSRIQILGKRSDQINSKKTPEVKDLEKSEPKQYHRCGSSIRESLFHPTSLTWNQSKEKTRINTIIERHDPSCRKPISAKKSLGSEAGASSSSSSKAASQQSCASQSIVSNSLRDKLSSKIVMKNDFIPELTKRYDERIQEQNREAQELMRRTSLLAKHNRLYREAGLEEQLARSIRLCEAVLDDREEPEEEPLPVLTPEMLQEIRQALVPHPPNQVVAQGFGLQITRNDLHTLVGLNWLNDEIINFYMNLLIVRGESGNFPKVHVMNTFFYPKLLSGGHSSLKRWTRKVDVFSKDLLVVPIHLGMHWCMSIIDFRDKSIRYFDSMGGTNVKCLNALKQYLLDESLDKKKQPFDMTGWKLECVKNVPQQTNGSDCGVFSCMFAEYISGNKRLTFTQKDMPYFRKKMVYEILKSKLL